MVLLLALVAGINPDSATAPDITLDPSNTKPPGLWSDSDAG